MFKLFCALLTITSSFVFFRYRVKRYLRFFQQQEYQNQRFLGWIKEKYAFDKRGTAIVGLGLLICAIFHCCQGLLCALVALGLIALATSEEDPERVGKIRLNMTERARRIYTCALCLYSFALLVAVLGVYLLLCPQISCVVALFILQFLLIQSTPFWLVLANSLLLPGENALQAKFLEEAKDILRRVDPYVIGITGSYGKTSVKSMLGEILSVSLGPTFWPPKSYNSPMGITREIRTRLRAGFRFAVIEMGAYSIGSIRRLCDLTPPKAAIVTAVGIMHLERFGSPENVYKAKSELPQAVPDEGILVCNGDNAGARRMASEYKKAKTFLYGLESSLGQLDCKITPGEINEKGQAFLIEWQGKTYQGVTKLLGDAALSNIAAAFTMSCALGASPELVIAAVSNLEPVDNRLSQKRDGSVLYLNDAYNSNPDGFRVALKALARAQGGRKILMTPGMIELGDRQEIENRNMAEIAGKRCDLVLVVGETNKRAWEEGLKASGVSTDKILYCKNREVAFSELAARRQEKDVILIENDLVDLYEMKVSF